jgi:type IV secretion system protein TrbL
VLLMLAGMIVGAAPAPAATETPTPALAAAPTFTAAVAPPRAVTAAPMPAGSEAPATAVAAAPPFAAAVAPAMSAAAAPAALAAPGTLAQQGGEGGVIDGLVLDYETAAASWLERIVPLAERTFALLATLELAVSGIWWALGRDGLDSALAALLRKFMLLSFLFSLIYLFPLWVPAITRGFEAAGQSATGTTAVNPAQLLDLGITIASNLLLAVGDAGFLADPTGNLLASATALLVVLAYAGVAAQICMTLVETYIVLTGGALFLGFAGFRGTAPFAEGYLLYAFQTGIRVYLLYLLAGVGTALSRQWAALSLMASAAGSGAAAGQPATPSLTLDFQILAGALVFCLLVWRVPAAVASRLTQGATLRLQEALR